MGIEIVFLFLAKGGRSSGGGVYTIYGERGMSSWLWLMSLFFLCRKLLMRWTVLSSDVLVFLPAVFYFIVAYSSANPRKGKNELAWLMAMILLNPCLVIIDHGHFQVNLSCLPIIHV